MRGPWLHLKVAPGWDVAFSMDMVERLVHHASPEYAALSRQAFSLSAVLGVHPDPQMPGVLALLRDGSCWHAGEVVLGRRGEEGRFLPVPPYLLERQPPWCQGVLEWEGGWAFVAESQALEALHG